MHPRSFFLTLVLSGLVLLVRALLTDSHVVDVPWQAFALACLVGLVQGWRHKRAQPWWQRMAEARARRCPVWRA